MKRSPLPSRRHEMTREKSTSEASGVDQERSTTSSQATTGIYRCPECRFVNGQIVLCDIHERQEKAKIITPKMASLILDCLAERIEDGLWPEMITRLRNIAEKARD